MSIIDETLKKLGGEPPAQEASPFFPKKNGADQMPDFGFIAAPRKRVPILLALALAGVVIYLLLPKWHGYPPVRVGASLREFHDNKIPARESKPEISSAIEPNPGWYKAGWKAVSAGNQTDAFALWEDGMRNLPKDHKVIICNSYATLDQFLPALNQHASMFPAIGVRQNFGGRALYRVIVFPYGGGTREVLPEVKRLFPHARLANASRVQKFLTRISLPVATDGLMAETALKLETAITQEQLAEHKPAEEKLKTVSGAAAEPGAGDWETRSATVREQLKEEDYAGVSKNAQALAHDFPERWESWFWLGTAQLARGQMDAAGTALEHAAKLNPRVAQIWVQRAIVAQERGDHATAVRLLNEARELAPKSPQIFLNLGYSNDALGLTDEADKSYLRFLSLTEGESSYTKQRKPVMERMEIRH